MTSDRRRVTLALSGVCALFVVAVLATVKITASHPRGTRQAGREPHLVAAAAPVAAGAAGGTARHRLTATQVLDGFTASYASFLDGGPVSGLRYASITAASQAIDGGRIPQAYRDGPLRISSAGEEGSTGFSAQATVVASNRSESYPFTVQMLYEQNGWQIAQIVPVDLTIDDRTRPADGVIVPAAAASAARRFAVAYVNYRAGVTPSLPGLAGVARRAIVQGTDSLAQTPLPRAWAVLESISYGPPSGSEFAATAAVKVARERETFSFLMVRARGGWVCGAFL